MRGRGPMGVLQRRWRWLAGAVLAGLVGGLGATLLATPTYQATAGTFFSLQYGNSAADLVQGSTYTQNQVESFATLATTPVVLTPVVEELGLDVSAQALATRITASAPLDTVLVEVSVTDVSAEQSARIANAVAESLSRTVEELAPEDADGDPTVQATTVAPAEVPSGQASPDLVVDLAAGLLLGLLAGLGLVALRELSDTRVRDAETLATLTPLPVVGSIGVLPRSADRPVVVELEPHGTAAESFRQLRTNLRFLGLSRDDEGATGAQVVSVTSSLAAEGKSTVAANLAVALAETGRVLLVDADLRRPSVATVLGLEGAAGLTTVLVGEAEPADVVQEWGAAGLHVLTAGALPPNPSELLGSPAMAALLARLRGEYDHVVLDTAPVLPVADAAILSRVVDGTLVVANVTRVRRHQLTETLTGLDRLGGRTLGVVLNQVRRDESAYTYETPAALQWAPARPVAEVGADTAPSPLPRMPVGARADGHAGVGERP